MSGNIRKSVIGCHDGLVDIEPESHSQWLDSGLDVESSVEVGVAGVSTIGAMEESFVSYPDFSAETTTLGCVFRTDIDNRTPVLQSLVFNKILQLLESPRVECPVESSAFVGADVLEILQRYDIPCFQTADNFLAYPMVLASHKTCPSAGQMLEVSLGRLRSFALQGSDELLMLEHPRHDAAVEFPIGGNGKMLYSDIDTENTPMLSRAQVGINIFGKAQAEEHAVPFVNPNETLVDFPVGVFGSISRERNIEFPAALDCAETQYSVLVGETPRRIESHGTFGDGRLRLGFFDHSTCLLDAGTGKLGRQTYLPQMMVNERMELDIVPGSVLPSGVNTILETCSVCIDGGEKFLVIRKFEIDCSSTQHINQIRIANINNPQFLLRTSSEVSLRAVL